MPWLISINFIVAAIFMLGIFFIVLPAAARLHGNSLGFVYFWRNCVKRNENLEDKSDEKIYLLAELKACRPFRAEILPFFILNLAQLIN